MADRMSLPRILVCMAAYTAGFTLLANGSRSGQGRERWSVAAAATQEDLAMAGAALRGSVHSPVLSRAVQVNLRVVDGYVRAPLLRGIKTGDAQAREAVVAIATEPNITSTAKTYLEAASHTDNVALRMIGLSGMVRVDRGSSLEDARKAFSAQAESMRCEAIAALVSLQGSAGLATLRQLSEPKGLFERCEIAAARVRLGDKSAIAALHAAYRNLCRSSSASAPNADWFPWSDLRKTYYRIVLQSVGIDARREAGVDASDPHRLAHELEQFAPAIQLIGGPYAYLRPYLLTCLGSKEPVLRGQAVRCLGRVPEKWANDLLVSRLRDDAYCTLNGAGYGWHASVACLAAICLLERGDASGVGVLRRWVARHRELIEAGKVFPSDSEVAADSNDYAVLRDFGPAVALARAGYSEAADVLEFGVEESLRRGNTGKWESSPAWKSYHLALLGRTEGVKALRALLTMRTDEWYSRFRVEAAGCIAALHAGGESGDPLIFPPAVDWAGPLFYPDCWREAARTAPETRDSHLFLWRGGCARLAPCHELPASSCPASLLRGR